MDASSGTWQSRLPSIFVDLGRLVVIVVSLGVLFSVVWGADVGGLFAACISTAEQVDDHVLRQRRR